MNRTIIHATLACLAMTLAACQPSAPDATAEAPAQAPDASAATPVADASAQLERLGELRIGAAFGDGPGDDAFKAAGMRELMDGECEHYDGGSLPEGVSMMVLGDRIARFDVYGGAELGVPLDAPPPEAPPVPFGLWVGMSVDEAMQRLPDGVVVSPHAYVAPDGDYLTWTAPEAGLAIRLETLGELVTAIYWGQPDAVELIEGCA